MRFASLALERYGHFEDCELTFRTGSPDLHVVYGDNEAGKSTSLAAVSDLLFGFQTRSPYNFIFDYSLLRVGAVLEDDGASFACRRKKGASGTLIDTDERPLDEGTLLAMLRGQSRETFGLSFSLNQDGLRAGGRAMVEARDDVGRALFAAGSGLTGVSDELARLEKEADAIWGPRAAARRSFTQAQRDLAEHTRAAREQALKPKTWVDARTAVAAAKGDLDQAEERRDEVQGQVRRAERIRRIAPSARLRADNLALLENHGETIDLFPHREEAAETAISEAETAVRTKAAAEQLAQEASDRIEALVTDPAMLIAGPQVDELVASAGAVDKAQRDLARLTGEAEAAAALVTRLQEEVGPVCATPPNRVVGSRLREMAQAHAKDAAVLAQIEESGETLKIRKRKLTDKIGEAQPAIGLEAIVAAVDMARALGSDADARCTSTRRRADLASTAVDQILARLAPWTGDAETLLALPRPGQGEIEEVRAELADLFAEAARERQGTGRAHDEAAALALEMEQLALGSAVSAEEIGVARSEREAQWLPLRDHILAGTAPKSPAGRRHGLRGDCCTRRREE